MVGGDATSNNKKHFHKYDGHYDSSCFNKNCLNIQEIDINSDKERYIHTIGLIPGELAGEPINTLNNYEEPPVVAERKSNLSVVRLATKEMLGCNDCIEKGQGLECYRNKKYVFSPITATRLSHKTVFDKKGNKLSIQLNIFCIAYCEKSGKYFIVVQPIRYYKNNLIQCPSCNGEEVTKFTDSHLDNINACEYKCMKCGDLFEVNTSIDWGLVEQALLQRGISPKDYYLEIGREILTTIALLSKIPLLVEGDEKHFPFQGYVSYGENTLFRSPEYSIGEWRKSQIGYQYWDAKVNAVESRISRIGRFKPYLESVDSIDYSMCIKDLLEDYLEMIYVRKSDLKYFRNILFKLIQLPHFQIDERFNSPLTIDADTMSKLEIIYERLRLLTAKEIKIEELINIPFVYPKGIHGTKEDYRINI